MTIENMTGSTFSSWFHSHPLDSLMNKISKWEKKGAAGRARVANLGVLALDLQGVFCNTLRFPLIALILPASSMVSTGASLARRVISLTRVDRPAATFRRKCMQVLPIVVSHCPTARDLGKSILKIVNYSLGFFSSLIVGFISVKANLWIHHQLGLICNPELAKQKRKSKAIMHLKKIECTKPYRKRIRKRIDEHTEEKLREHLLAPSSAIKEGLLGKSRLCLAIEEATKKKREEAKINYEKQRGRALGSAEWDLIKAKYWKNLTDPFVFKKELEPDFHPFLTYYFNWRSEGIVKNQPFAFKSLSLYHAYMACYYRWNLTPEEVSQTISSIILPREKKKARIEATRDTYYALYFHTVLKEQKCIDYDRRIEKALQAKAKEQRKILSAGEIEAIDQEIKAFIKAQETLLEAARVNQNLSMAKIHYIIENQAYEFNEAARKELEDFALQASHHLKQRMTAATAEVVKRLRRAKDRKDFSSIEHFSKLKDIVTRQLNRLFTSSSFKNTAYDLKNDKTIDQAIMESAKNAVECQVESRLAQSNAQSLSSQDREILKKHYEKIEVPRLYEQLWLRKYNKNFSLLENRRGQAFHKIMKRMHERSDGKRVLFKQWIKRVDLPEGHESNLPIDNKAIRPDKNYADVTIIIPENEDINSAQIIFKGHERMRNANAEYMDGRLSTTEFTFKELEKLVRQSKKVFKKVAARYRFNKTRIRETYLGVNGINYQEEHYQAMHLKQQFEEHKLWEVFGTLSEKEAKRKRKVVTLKAHLVKAKLRANKYKEKYRDVVSQNDRHQIQINLKE
ncbi:hypothetical protein [Neochlamydia sp. S13]|uniref:hypothetical protein n=1 Tax=Neochlamydia sp. S13 TaxID=1353976 RepID=UPI0005AB6A09|nr:hypothetical protein [Neochlamydia sp. S13]